MLRYIRPMNRFLNKWLKENGFEGCKVKFDSNFGYAWQKDIIYYSTSMSEIETKLFKKFAKINGIKNCPDILVLAFFHELGHRETEYDLSQSEYNLSMEIKEELDNKEVKTIDDYFAYYNSPSEYAATEWAIDYINHNKTLISNFWVQFEEILNKFYRKNKLFKERH